MNSPLNISALREQLTPASSVSNSKEIQSTVELIRTTINKIIWIVQDPMEYSSQELESQLWVISQFFRTTKFTTLTIPVLEILAKDDSILWSRVKVKDTNMPLVPSAFEQIPKSTAEIRDITNWSITKVSQRDRELHLLWIYLAPQIQELKKDDSIEYMPTYMLANNIIGSTFLLLSKKK